MSDGTPPADLSYVESFSPGHGHIPARASGARGSVQLSLNGTWTVEDDGVLVAAGDLDVPAVPAAGSVSAGFPEAVSTAPGPAGELATPYVRPQENGNRMHARSLTLTGDAGKALAVTGDPPVDFAVRRWSPELLTAARHTPDLIPDGRTHLHLDAAHHGIGSASCGPPLPPGHSLAAHAVAWTLRFSA
jgi:hypothetical protein